MTFDQTRYWKERHKKLLNDPRSVGNLSRSVEQNIQAQETGIRIVTRAAKILKPATSVLDLGCGIGRVSICFTDEGYRYLGVDVSKHAVRQARSKNPAAKFIVADLALWEAGRQFDVVCALYVFVHFVDDERWKLFLRRALSWVKPGGALLFADNFSNTRTSQGQHVVVRPLASYEEVFDRTAFKLDPLFTARLIEGDGSEGDAISSAAHYLLARRAPDLRDRKSSVRTIVEALARCCCGAAAKTPLYHLKLSDGR